MAIIIISLEAGYSEDARPSELAWAGTIRSGVQAINSSKTWLAESSGVTNKPWLMSFESTYCPAMRPPELGVTTKVP
jgi:hypothetical protein